MVDLKKNESVMKDAWREVTNSSSDVDWALFGYEGQTNVLKLVSKGDDGIEGMTEDFNPSKILYGFIKVEDPKTSLPKFVLLNWQGETAPGNRKGMCAMHLRDIERFLSGHHLTVNIRNEDEIDMDAITKKVSEITGSSYNFKQKPQGMEHSPEPVGTAHRKINPLQELPKMSEREKFWSQDQDDEKKRIVEDRERRSTVTRREEAERVSREEKEKNLRENQIKEREKKISMQRDQEKISELDRYKGEKSLWQKQQEEDVNEARERSQRSEKMRQDRAKEAKELIQNRPGDAKKLFTRNSSQGQMNLPRGKPPSIVPKTNAVAPVPSSETKPVNQPTSSIPPIPVSQFSVTEPTPEQSPDRDQDQQSIAPPPGFQQEESDGSAAEEVDLVPGGDLHRATPLNLEKGEEGALQSYGVCAVSLYDYQASDETEITFDPGQIITHIDQIDPGWWQGLGPDGAYGLFPANYVEIIDNSELQIQA